MTGILKRLFLGVHVEVMGVFRAVLRCRMANIFNKLEGNSGSSASLTLFWSGRYHLRFRRRQ